MSSVSKTPSNNISTEESGWTTYFEDFFNNHHQHHDDNHNCSMSFSGVATTSSSSLFVSDAASFVEKKVTHSGEQVEEFSVSKNGKRSSITAFVHDDALEDTATSPLTSSKEEGNSSGQTDEQKELMSFNGRDSDCTEIRKRGLGLVPLSMDILCWRTQRK